MSLRHVNVQWRSQDCSVGVCKSIILPNFLPKTAWKWKKLDRERRGSERGTDIDALASVANPETWLASLKPRSCDLYTVTVFGYNLWFSVAWLNTLPKNRKYFTLNPKIKKWQRSYLIVTCLRLCGVWLTHPGCQCEMKDETHVTISIATQKKPQKRAALETTFFL